ncbi:hypothetical protein HMPREF9946_02654 [Acetobacteraceae bacterium AT-5844]|nr:hypothetical protein HMPREF9946_02654 [Acetobacteraceae bacterium AT-5844]
MGIYDSFTTEPAVAALGISGLWVQLWDFLLIRAVMGRGITADDRLARQPLALRAKP